jgi:putative transposase
LRDSFGDYIKKLLIGIGKQSPEIEIIEVNTDVHYIHILLSIPPKFSVSEAVKILKAKTGLGMRKKFPFLGKLYWGVGGIWLIGYFVTTIGIAEETIRKYVQMQGKEDSGQVKLEF